MGKRWIIACRLAVLAVFLAAWQFLPQIAAVRELVTFLNPFFISSPSRVYDQLTMMVVGDDAAGVPAVWPYLANTLKATLIGTAIGITVGTLLGVILSNSDNLSAIFTPYIILLNTIPRIALIPIVILIVGATLKAGIIICTLVVTFLTFFNALAGGRSVPKPMIQNSQLLAASPRQIMLRVRLPMVLMWVFAALPTAIAFGLLSVVTTEVITGSKGMGSFILVATSLVDSDLAFAVVVILGAVGITLVTAAEALKRAVLHWA